jgi:hypothetical protein
MLIAFIGGVIGGLLGWFVIGPWMLRREQRQGRG